jgi:dTDP-4-dehydrorhamnose 3,5-epimerase
MEFFKTALGGTVVVIPEPIEDERGFFARTFCRREFAARGFNPNLAQCSLSFNPRKGTLRGIHYQKTPRPEAKLIRCTRGAVYDVVIDLRRESPTYLRWFAIELSADNRKMIYVAEGFAHGFLTLTDDAEVFYQISEFYSPEHQRGVRWNDPVFAIVWPSVPLLVSARDAGFSDFVP